MNDLELPPRRTLAPEVRDRIRTAVHADTHRSRPRHRAPLSVAAAVTVLVAGAVVIGQTSNTPDGSRAGATPPPPTATVPGTDPELTVTQPNAQSEEDLDRCWEAVQASQRAEEFGPRSTWQPVFTVTRARPTGANALLRVTAFLTDDGDPEFCELADLEGPDSAVPWIATVSDPSAEPISLATSGSADVSGLFYSRTGMLAGVAPGVDSLRFDQTNLHPDTGMPVHSTRPAVFQDGLFVVEVGWLHDGSVVGATGFDGAGNEVTSGEWAYDPTKDPLIGPSLTG